MSNRRKKPSTYYWLLIVTIALLLFGSVMIFSASSVIAFSREGDSYFYLKKQLLWVLAGLPFMGLLSKISYQKLRRFSHVGLVLSFLLLILVLIPGIGRTAGGANRWIEIGSFTFQPSELAKLAVILFAADLLARKKDEIGELPPQLLMQLLLMVGGISLLILLQPHLGNTFIICLTVFVMMYLAGANLVHIFGIGALGGTLCFIVAFCEHYRRQRLLAFLNPWADPRNTGFQIIQSLFAFGSGGLRGLGLGMSHQKFFYLPAAHTDFIFAIIGEELGLIGTLLTIFAFLLLAFLGIKVSFKCRDLFGKLLGSGITFMILGQAVINMGAVTGILPITGVPMPLVSFGGSALIFALGGIGILLNIASEEKKIRKNKLREKDEGNHKRWGNSRTRVSRAGPSRSFRVYRGSA
jgi:cell division protein FtsW